MLKISRVLFIVLFAACGQEDTASGSAVNPSPFFDLEAYFAGEIARLDSLQPELKKIASIDGEMEEQEIKTTDFGEELRVFRRSDINRPSWSDKYQVDSVLEDASLKAVRYTALDTTLYTRFLSISFQNGAVDSIRIKNRAHSLIASTEQDLLYLPGRSYRIKSKQKTVGSETREIVIEVEIEKE